MTVREWKYEDILRISEIEKECFSGAAWTFQMLASSFESESFFGFAAVEENEVCGYGGINIAADAADIGNIAVTEQYRNSGVGTAILNELCSAAKSRGVVKMFLEVRVSNAAAMKLYLKNGFIGVYARTRYYPDGEDCLVMMKIL